MMRPTTKKVPKTYTDRDQAAENVDMMISGTSTSTPGMPRYKSLKSNIHEDEGNEMGINAGKSSARRSESKTGGFGTRKNSTSATSLTKLDKQKNQPNQKKSTVSSRPVGFGSSTGMPKAKGATTTGSKLSVSNNAHKDSDFSRRQESIQGIGIGRSSIRNSDICDELVLSKEGMRFDQKQRDRDEYEAKNRAKDDEDDALMREADAVLAQTNDMLGRRKEALYAKHIEGRESLNEIDFVYDDRTKPTMTNWLDDQRQKDQLAEEEEKINKSQNTKNLYDWNAKMDKEFGLEISNTNTTKDQVKDLEKFEEKYQGLNLNIGQKQTEKKNLNTIERMGGVVEAARTKGPWASPRSDEQMIQEIVNKKAEPVQINQLSLKAERDRMLQMIKNNKKAEMEEISKPIVKRTTADILGGIGAGILDDLSMSIHQHKNDAQDEQIEDKKSQFDISEDKKIGDSTFDAFNGSKFQKFQHIREEAEASERSANIDFQRKAVRFAEENESLYSHQESRLNTGRHSEREQKAQISGQKQRKSSEGSSDGDQGANKLAGLNQLLKNKDFKLGDDDEPDFAAFLSKLAEKRGVTNPVEMPATEKVAAEQFYKREPVLEDEGSDEQGDKTIDNTQEIKKKTLQRYDDDLENILAMKPRGGREIIFGAEADQEQEKKAITRELLQEPETKKVVVPTLEMIQERPVASPEKSQPVPGSSKIGSKKYDEFMRFMEGIEDEMTSQYERSSQRDKHRNDVDDLQFSRKQPSPPRKAAPEQRQAPGSVNQQIADIEESLESSSYAVSAMMKQKSATQNVNSKVEPREAYNKIRENMLELEIERDEQQKALELLKEVRDQERKELTRAVQEARAEGGEYAEQIRNEMAARIEKQVQMIEALLEDKRELQESVEGMQIKMKESASQQDKQCKVLEDKLQVELKRNRDAWQASEKVRKERWEKEKVNEIRAQTVKGLEPEIQRIVERNKEDLRRAEERHQNEMRERKQEILQEQENKFQDMRERLTREKEEALDGEREKTQQKLHDQYERLENQFNEERLRWKSNVYGEYDRLESQRKREKDSLEEQLQKASLKRESEVEKEHQKNEEKVAGLQRKHNNEIKRIREEEQIAKEQWMETYQSKCEDQKQDFQKRVREEMVKERNREIESIINKLGDETHDTQKQLMTQYERKVSAADEKRKADIESYKGTVQQWKDKFQSEQNSRQMLDENLRILGRRINDLEIDIQDKKDFVEKLESEKFELSEKLASAESNQSDIRGEIEDEARAKVLDKEREIRKLREQIQDQEHSFNLESEQLKNQNKNDLEMIQEKVAAAMQKKKEIIETLHDEIRLKDLQVTKLKEMLEKQRRELLMAQ